MSTGFSLEPSMVMQTIAPRVQSFLSSYSQREDDIDGDATFSPYSAKSNLDARGTSEVSGEDLAKWETPHLPLLTRKQLKMSLIEIARRQAHKKGVVKKRGEAAILVPIVAVEGVPSLLLTRRSSTLSTHASQISFPGGYVDEADSSGPFDDKLINASLREMQEELNFGIVELNGVSYGGRHDSRTDVEKPPFMSILGVTRPIPQFSGSMVTPVIASINYDLHAEFIDAIFPGNESEVDWIFSVAISDLAKNETTMPLRRFGKCDGSEVKGDHTILGPAYPVPKSDKKREGDVIWGLTAVVIRSLLRKVFKPALEGICVGSKPKL